MTESRAFRRRFRSSGSDRVPEQLAQWFRGEIADTWYRLLPNEVELLPTRWRSYKAEHPDTVPPPGYTWLNDLSDPRHPTEDQVRAARKLLLRSQ